MSKTCLTLLLLLPKLGPARGHNFEGTLISGLLVAAAVFAQIKREMKGRRQGQTECLFSSLPVEEILLEQGCGNAKASS